jgi:hypothetical protein
MNYDCDTSLPCKSAQLPAVMSVRGVMSRLQDGQIVSDPPGR